MPSDVVHKHANPELKGDTWSFNFDPSMEADAHDYWRKYQHATKEVGRYIRSVLRSQVGVTSPLLAAGSGQQIPTGVLWARLS